MSLRARLLAGCVVIAVLLAGAALLITRRTEAHLLDRVDGQLAPRIEQVRCSGERALTDSPSEPAPVEPDGAVDGGDQVGGEEPGPSVGETTLGCPQVHLEHEADDAAPPTEGEGLPTPGDPVQDQKKHKVGNTFTAPGSVMDFFAVLKVTDDGAEALQLPADGPPQPDIDLDEARAAAKSGEPYTAAAIGSGSRWRVRAAEDDEGTLYVVGQSLDDVDAIVEGLILVEVAVTLAILAALGLVAWWVDRHGIRPIKQMTTTATAIAGGDLSHRVPESHEGTEAGRLGTALNQMLGRIEEAFDERSRSEARLRQFVSDASHELRTPVTTIRGYSDLYETGALDDRAELAEAMRRTRQETLRMGSLVDDLLLLARLDEGPELTRAEVDLAALVDDAGRDAKAVDPAREVETRADEPLVVLGDSDRLRQVLANLVGNALVHTPSTAGLELRARRDHDRAVVEIADHGPGMPAEVAHRAFERFYRADPSRSRHRGGSGLGLAIVQATVAVHGGEVWLESLPGEGTTACVALPLVDA